LLAALPLWAGDLPNLDRPTLTAQDLANLINIAYVKGRLPNVKGFQIESYEIVFRDYDGNLTPLAKSPTPYTYDAHKQGDVGEMIIAMKVENKMIEITVVARNYDGSQKQLHRLKLPEDCMMVCNHEFNGKTGDTDKDLNYVVNIGDNEVFTFTQKGSVRDAKPAAIILRTHAKKVPSESGK